MSDCSYRMTISGSGEGLASLIISKVSHFPAAGLAIIIGRVAPGDTALMAWATKHRKRRPVARDDVELEIVYGNQTTRKISIKKAAVLGYTETYDAANGLGRFELVIQQHCFGDKEHCYVPVPQKDGSLLHVVYRLDLLCLDFLDELAGLKRAPGSSITHPFADNEWSQPPALPQCLHFPTDWAIPLSISFNLIRWDRETVHGQLELDLTTDIGHKLLGSSYNVIQDRIVQLIADGYRTKDVLLEKRSQTVGRKTVKCDLAEWYQVSTNEKRMKVAAPRIKLEYNNIRPKTTKGSGIPGALEFVKAAPAAAATAQAEAALVAETVLNNVPEETVKAQNPLPNFENAKIDSRKLTEYALNPDHPIGQNKAKVFKSALGYNKSNANLLIKQIYDKLPQSEAIVGKLDQYGQRYTMDMLITGVNGNTAIVRTGWIIKPGSDTPELTTLYVK